MNLKKMGAAGLERCVQKKLQQLSKNSANKTLGEKLVSKQHLELAPFKAVPFSGWGDWEQDPLKNRSWQWRLNWLSFLSYLMAYHRASGDEVVLESAREAIQSWLDAYLETDTSYPFEFIWHDHATALRAEQLVLFAYFCREHAPEWASKHTEFLATLEQALVVHGQWLAKDSFYSEHTNHGLEQARVLLLLGTVFEGEQAREWQQIAIQRISSELTFAFTDEGVHVENSPAYHVFVFKVFLGIIKDYPEEVLGNLAEQFSQFSAKALSFITHILRPDGKLPPIGDTEQLPTSDAYREMFGNTIEYQNFLYAISQGSQGLKPNKKNQVYVRSGYAVFRDCWPSSAHFSKAFHIIAKIGCSSRYHHQQDEGHVSICAGGEDWLIDSGLYNYINKDPVRKYMRGRLAHNVPIVSNARYADNFEHRLSAWRIESYSELRELPYVDMHLDVLPSVSHQRRLQFDSLAKVVKISDTISCLEASRRNVTLQWHFPKDKSISIEGQQVIIASKSGNKLTLCFEGASPDDISIVKGQKGEKVLSCISYKANTVEPSQCVRVLFRDKKKLDVVTRFSFLMANKHIAPQDEVFSPDIKSLSSLISGIYDSDSVIKNSVMLGSHSFCSQLAKLHRDQKVGVANLLISTPLQCSETLKILEKDYLSPWVSCAALNLTGTAPVSVDEGILDGVAGIDLLVVTKAGFEENELESAMLLMLPQLLSRMNADGHVWISDDLPERCKRLCIDIVHRSEKSVVLVVGLD
ncbi:hypothetical protein PZ78_16000 [Vreelandella venusta]|nr:hypothetical protein PZ78_16000 [Halomonas hydrothermalis]